MFPLFRLDRLSIDNVLSNFESSELFELSLCSKATFNTIKGLTKEIRNRYELEIDIIDKGRIHVIRKSCGWWTINVHNISKLEKPMEYKSVRIIKGIFLAAYYENGDMNTYWVNEHQGFNILIEHLTELYRLSVQYMHYNHNYNSGRSAEILDWIDKSQQPFKTVKAKFEPGFNLESFDNVLDRLKSVEEMKLKVVPTNWFIRNHQRKYEFKSLIIKKGYWVTLPRLLTMNCVELYVYNTELSNIDVNLFLKNWMYGSCSQLKELTLGGKDLDISMIMSDVPYQVNEERYAMLKNDYPYYLDNSAPIHCDIRGLDGAIATVFSKLESTTLNMRVWD